MQLSKRPCFRSLPVPRASREKTITTFCGSGPPTYSPVYFYLFLCAILAQMPLEGGINRRGDGGLSRKTCRRSGKMIRYLVRPVNLLISTLKRTYFRTFCGVYTRPASLGCRLAECRWRRLAGNERINDQWRVVRKVVFTFYEFHLLRSFRRLGPKQIAFV